MKRVLTLTMLLVVLVSATAIGAGGPDPQVQQLRKQLRSARLDNADLKQQIDAQNGVIEDQADTINRLRNRIANQPDPLDAILNRDADARWQAMVAIWRAAPTLPEGELCGYDKNNVPGDGDGLTLTSFTFYRWSGC